MPYYCTVPRCTSMAGKAKNVSFHQFPRDEELARLWNDILKRGKPYTKYSKVCSLHFRPEDYTITSVGKNKGQWRTLRKDAIPSQNLPLVSPPPSTHRTRSSGMWTPNSLPTGVIDPQIQHQMAQAIYMQTMLAMQAANGTQNFATTNATNPTDLSAPHPSNISITDIERILQKHAKNNAIERLKDNQNDFESQFNKNTSYKCKECSKCFKDPDVFVLHRRTHSKNAEMLEKLPDNLPEKENLNSNSDLTSQDTLRANPILANLLKSGIAPSNDIPETVNSFNAIFDANNILSIENQIMTALAANMESYIRNLSSILTQQQPKSPEESSDYNENEGNSTENDNVDGESSSNDNFVRNDSDSRSYGHDFQKEYENFNNSHKNIEIDQSLDQTENLESNNENNEETKNFEIKIEMEPLDLENDPSSPEKNDRTTENDPESVQNSKESTENVLQNFAHKVLKEEVEDCQNLTNKGSENRDTEPACDKEDLNDSRDSSNLVIDENL